MDHNYLCVCAACNYERVVKRVQEKYSTASNTEPTWIDPQNPFLDQREKDKREAFKQAYSEGSTTGRFKVRHPPYQTKPRIKHPGKYRRVHNESLDMIEFQYQPWPDAEWRTYFKLAHETLTRSAREMGLSWAVKQSLTNAAAALDLERFYKIERIS